MARPTQKEAALKVLRNEKMIAMAKRGYPSVYIAEFFGVSKGTISKIIKGRKESRSKNG